MQVWVYTAGPRRGQVVLDLEATPECDRSVRYEGTEDEIITEARQDLRRPLPFSPDPCTPYRVACAALAYLDADHDPEPCAICDAAGVGPEGIERHEIPRDPVLDRLWHARVYVCGECFAELSRNKGVKA